MFLSSGLIFALLSHIAPLCLVLIVANWLVWTYVLRSIVCEQCDQPVAQTAGQFYRKPRLIQVAAGLFKRSCDVCGADFTRKKGPSRRR
ncbi:MAG TPA: hypothetical protein VGC21_07525 [Telluria sp.]